jgi:hypothetical protein
MNALTRMIGIQNNVKAPAYNNWGGQVLEVAVNDGASNGVNMVVQVCSNLHVLPAVD